VEVEVKRQVEVAVEVDVLQPCSLPPKPGNKTDPPLFRGFCVLCGMPSPLPL
jgi:hypothetical protein